VTDDSNLINLDTESYNLLLNLVAYYSLQQQQGLDAQFYDGNFFLQEYTQALAAYKAMYKSEIQKPQSTYYATPSKGYNRIIGRDSIKMDEDELYKIEHLKDFIAQKEEEKIIYQDE